MHKQCYIFLYALCIFAFHHSSQLLKMHQAVKHAQCTFPFSDPQSKEVEEGSDRNLDI